MNYTNDEYADIHLILGEARGNSSEAELLHAETLPNCRLPSCPTFHVVDQRLWVTGTLQHVDHQCSARTVVAEETSLIWWEITLESARGELAALHVTTAGVENPAWTTAVPRLHSQDLH
jgi:hypothetical protein